MPNIHATMIIPQIDYIRTKKKKNCGLGAPFL